MRFRSPLVFDVGRVVFVIATGLFCVSCETTGNPWTDDIRFSPSKARVRIAAKQQELAALRSWALDEQIRLSEMRLRLRQAARDRVVGEASLAVLDREIGDARVRLSQLEADSAAALDHQEQLRSLRVRQARLRDEVRSLDMKLATILKLQYLPQQ